MKYIILILATLAALATSARAECVLTPEAVLAGHPGAHAVYITRGGVKCWMLDKHKPERKVMRNDSGMYPDRAKPESRPLRATGAALAGLSGNPDVLIFSDPLESCVFTPVLACDDMTETGRAIKIETTGAAEVKPINWFAEYDELFQEQPKRAAPVAAVVVPARKLVAAAVTSPGRARSTTGGALRGLVIAGSTIGLVWLIVILIVWFHHGLYGGVKEEK